MALQGMALQDWRPRLAADYAVVARTYTVDIGAALALFVTASFAAGRVWRFPFDDELLTRVVAERGSSVIDFTTFFLGGGDVHPPLAFLIFYGMVQAGFADWGVRLFSLAMTGLSLALFHVLCLMLMQQRVPAGPPPLIRLMAVLLFGLCPMAISQGDAMRWYPLFAALVTLAVVFYLAAENSAARLLSAIALGLAASTNFLAIFAGLALMAYRYGCERQFRWRFEAAYWALAAGFGMFGLITAVSIATRRWGAVQAEVFPLGIVNAAAIDALGILGGVAVGVGNAWLIVSAAVVLPFGLVAAVDRQRPAAPVHLLLLMLAAVPVMALAGFAEPRSFLYLMPMTVTLLVLFISAQDIKHGAGRSLTIFALLFVTSIGAIANINRTTHPFKRNAIVPFQDVINFIDGNSGGRVLVVSTDPVLAWLLQHEASRAGRCASYFLQNAHCLGSVTYDTIFVVSGHSNRSRRERYMRGHTADVAGLTAGKRRTALVPFGFDADAALKQWLMKTPLGAAILTVELYR